MAVISTFDQWQKDVFFSAAEEVQESADLMESVYRMWIRECNDKFEPQILDELRRELHTTLGTAKWQLEEFERAVNLSHEYCSSNETTVKRHREFVVAIRNKISHIEKTINDSLHKEGKQPLLWIQLDEDERDDFENFLSTAPQNLQKSKVKYVNHESVRGFKDTMYAVEVEAQELSKVEDEAMKQEENLQDVGAWKIVIADEADEDKKLVDAQNYVSSLSSTFGSLEYISSKFKLFRNSFGKVKTEEDHIPSRRGSSNYLDLKRVSLFNQGINELSERSRSCFDSCNESPKGSSLQQNRKFSGLQRHFQVSHSNKRSLLVTFLLMVTIFFIVPFVLYST